jgi:hypothetical protein
MTDKHWNVIAGVLIAAGAVWIVWAAVEIARTPW